MVDNVQHFYQLLLLLSILPLFGCFGLGLMHLISKLSKSGVAPLAGSFVMLYFGIFLGMVASAALVYITGGVLN